MDVLVTGGSGCIGRCVVDELVARDHSVTIFDRAQPHRSSVEYVSGDVTNESAVKAAVDGNDVVVHLAALIRSDRKQAIERVNVGGTLNVLEAAAITDARILYASSKAVFGALGGRYGHPEYTPLGPDAPREPVIGYGVTKLASEHYCELYAEQRGLDVAILRFGGTYGPGQVEGYADFTDDDEDAVAVTSSLVERAARGESVTLTGGDQLEDYAYLRDIANGVADAVETPTWTYPAYHISSGTLVSLRDFKRVLDAEFPAADVTIQGGLNHRRDRYPMYCRMDISRARSDLGFEPQYSLREGVLDHVETISNR